MNKKDEKESVQKRKETPKNAFVKVAGKYHYFDSEGHETDIVLSEVPANVKVV